MRNGIWLASVTWLLATSQSFGQVNSSPHFEVASVRPAGTGGRGLGVSGGPGTNDPGRITFERTTLEILIQVAYGGARALPPDQISGPDWLRSEWYKVAATMPPITTVEQYRKMMANLLAERFGLVAHHASKEVPGYNLSVMPGGPKLRRRHVNLTAQTASECAQEDDGLRHCRYVNMSMLNFANSLGRLLSSGPRGFVKVVDQTGLTGEFDFQLGYPAPSLTVDPVDVPRLLTEAVTRQLGLKLTSAKIKLDMVVIDHAEKVPTGN